jgi:hypothetical protein
MKVFLSTVDGGVMVQARLEGKDGGGDVTQLVAPGGDFLAHSHDDLAAMGEGEKELTDAGR